MARDINQIRIESIFGGHSLYPAFPAKDEYRWSLGIDPEPNGFISPTYYPRFAGDTINGAPMWIKKEPKTNTIFVYDSVGSIYTANANTITALADLNDGGTSSGNGLEYYDNYIYASRDTTIARYGPLNGTPTWTDDYWVSTLGKTALSNTLYPQSRGNTGYRLRNHFLKRGKDGRLYIADVVGNQGTIHYISTTKTTVEGDTDNGSTYGALDLPYGYWPAALENYGNTIVIACVVASGDDFTDRVKIVFWDPTNTTTYDSIIDSEYPDEVLCGLHNANGVLYLLTGFTFDDSNYIRISRYIGGYSFEQVAVVLTSQTTLPGGVDSNFNRLFFGSQYSLGSVGAIGLSKSKISNSVYNVSGVTCTSSSFVSAILFTKDRILSGWNSSSPAISGMDGSNAYLANDNPRPRSSIALGPYTIGSPFKITKVTIPFNDVLEDSTIDVYIKVDTLTNDADAQDLIATLTQATYGQKSTISIRPENKTGNRSFILYLDFRADYSQQSREQIALPIIVEYELIRE